MIKKVLAVFLVVILLFSPLSALPVGASNPNDPDGDDDNDSDGYDADRDGEISDEEKKTGEEPKYNFDPKPQFPPT